VDEVDGDAGTVVPDGGDGLAARPGIPDPQQLLPDAMLTELATLPTSELRSRRAACEEAEEGVSYARRLLQGRLDLLRAELAGRDGRGAASLVEALPGILAGGGSHGDPMKARATRLRVPPSADAHAEALDAIADEATLLDPRPLSLDELSDLVAALNEHERQLSTLRHALFQRIDALRDELAARYKDGRADIKELLR
jgi:hypothetical protein